MTTILRSLLERYRVIDGDAFALTKFDPSDDGDGALDRAQAEVLLAEGVQRLAHLQSLLYPQNRWALLCLFQGMDASGKDGTIRHVMSGVNPQGVTVSNFKAPTSEELGHDFLWRVARRLPERGQIGIFNRSHYEEVLAVRVHPQWLAQQHVPPSLIGKHVWRNRLEDIATWERYLGRQGTLQLKFFLHISKQEQRRRLLDRLATPAKAWKFSAADLAERGFWDKYQDAYQEAISATAAQHAPWFVIPADHKWFARLLVVEAMVEALEALDLKLPSISPELAAQLETARRALSAENTQ